MNTPDKWAIIGFKGPDEHHRVLAGWYGGYLYGDYWRINSGITKVEEDGDYYLFHGYSGSVYKCHKDSYGLSSLTAGVYLGLEKHHNVEVLPSTTDWLSLLKEEDKWQTDM
jgi:hypothetical protein